jgi:predicted enzyme related to lactoylglutathione lyase
MRIVHFELPADDPTRCIRFYERAFGWRFEKWDGPIPYWMIKTGEGPGIDGGMAPRQHPGQQPTNVVSVQSVDDSTRAIVAAGGTTTMPKMAVPGIGWTAYFTDTEGTPFGIIQFDPTAS